MQSGNTILAWQDMWDNQILSVNLPHLFSFVKDKFITLEKMAQTQDLYQLLYTPISEEANQELSQLQGYLNNLILTQEKDKWCYIWGNDFFSSVQIYKRMIGHTQIHQTYGWLWKSTCRQHHKVFFWLLLKDRLTTRDILGRKNMDLPTYNCPFCDQRETISHLFIHCYKAKICWASIGLTTNDQLNPFENLVQLKADISKPFFMEIIVIMCWVIWTIRNKKIFNNEDTMPHRCKILFQEEFAMVIHRAKASYHPEITQWLQQLN